MDRTITDIRIADDIQVKATTFPGYDGSVVIEGALISFDTGEQMIIGISAGQNCCENYGYLISEDDVRPYIGAKLTGYSLTSLEDAQTHNKLIDAEFYDIPAIDEGDAAFVDLMTDRGSLQFTIYNSHNGYYGHSVYIAIGKDILLEGYF